MVEMEAGLSLRASGRKTGIHREVEGRWVGYEKLQQDIPIHTTTSVYWATLTLTTSLHKAHHHHSHSPFPTCSRPSDR